MMPTDLMVRALKQIAEERGRQDAKWGEQNHDPFAWITILVEEVGEVSERAWEMRFGEEGYAAREGYRQELIEVAAVACAMVECFDRYKWKWGGHKR